MKKILLVDDDKDLCDEIAEILESKGYYVRTAFDGLQAKKNIDQNHYDLILLDIKLPRLSGLKLLEQLKKKENSSKVMIISAAPQIDKLLGKQTDIPDDGSEKILGLADNMIRKPYEVEELLNKIQTTIP